MKKFTVYPSNYIKSSVDTKDSISVGIYLSKNGTDKDYFLGNYEFDNMSIKNALQSFQKSNYIRIYGESVVNAFNYKYLIGTTQSDTETINLAVGYVSILDSISDQIDNNNVVSDADSEYLISSINFLPDGSGTASLITINYIDSTDSYEQVGNKNIDILELSKYNPQGIIMDESDLEED